MKFKVVRSTDTKEQDYGSIKVKELLNHSDISNLSVSIVTISGTNKKIINKRGDAVYYILEGSGTFNIDGEDVKVNRGDLIYIPKETPYFDRGNLVMLAINSPSFIKDFIQYLD